MSGILILKLTALNRPFITAIIIDDSIDEMIRTIKLAESDGADSFEVNLHSLEPFPPTKWDLKDIFACTNKPAFTVNRRMNQWAKIMADQGAPERRWQRFINRKVSTEEERMQLQIDAFEAGSAGFDMELDTFDPWMEWDKAKLKKNMQILKKISPDPNIMPHEVTYDNEAVKKQMSLIDDIHSRGGEVMISAHVGIAIKPEGALIVGKEMKKRNADLAKIYVVNSNLYDLLDTLSCNLLLKKELKIPFNMVCSSPLQQPSRLGYILFLMFGSSWVYCQQRYRPEGPGGFLSQPLVSEMHSLLTTPCVL